MASTEFRSPLRKLVAFFEVSRDKWKAKCQRVKYELKLLKRRFQNIRKSRNLWKQRSVQSETQRQQLQDRCEYLQGQNQKLQDRLEGPSKRGTPARS
jgi:chromosome segregation ATPase